MTAHRRPPHSVQVLQRWVGELAKEQAVAPGRIQRWISFMVVAAMLEHARDESDDPLFALKGGAALELRLGLRARATKDFDAAYREAMSGMLDRLDAALRRGHGDFTATRSEPRRIAGTQALRLDVKLAYRGRSWSTVQLEVADAEGAAGKEIERVPAKPLNLLGLDGPTHVPCVSIRYQIAQKLHACTEVPPGARDNDRFRDLIDLLLIQELVDESAWPSVRSACEELFQLRSRQGWPPSLTVSDTWPGPYGSLARELGFPITDVEEAADAVRALIDRIADG